MPTFGTNSRSNIPLYLRFRMNGTDTGWPQPYRISPFSNSSESVDGRYRISDLDFQIIDPNGSYFATQFGKGTSCFGSSLEVVAYIGGTMDYSQKDGSRFVYGRLGTAGGYAATLHTGRIYSVAYQSRLIRIRSKSALAQLGEMKWQFPVTAFSIPAENGAVGTPIIFGSQYFYNGNLTNTYIATNCFYNLSNSQTRWDCRAYVHGSEYLFSAIGFGYPPQNGRGSNHLLDTSRFSYLGTDSNGNNFYDQYEMLSASGSYISKYYGTIDNDALAREYGYNNRGAAEAAKTGAGTYSINLTRLTFSGTDMGSKVHMVSRLQFDESPGSVFQLLITGGMVTPFFTSADIDTTFLLNSSKTTAFSNFNRTIPFEEGKVLDSFKDFMACTQGLFSVNSSNLFQWQCYGPKNLNQTIEAIGTSDIVSSSFDNSEDDYFNRFIIKYNWDFLSNRSLNKVEGKLAGWNKSYDRPLEINAKWINSTNEANILCYRLQVRYKNTIPHVNFRTNLNKVGYDLGTLLSVSDVNSGLSNKIVQLVSFQKDWENKTIDWNALDAESLYMRRGFAFWMGGTTLPGEAVSGTSISGWGTNGTVTNINTTIFGTQFVWF